MVRARAKARLVYGTVLLLATVFGGGNATFGAPPAPSVHVTVYPNQPPPPHVTVQPGPRIPAPVVGVTPHPNVPPPHVTVQPGPKIPVPVVGVTPHPKIPPPNVIVQPGPKIPVPGVGVTPHPNVPPPVVGVQPGPHAPTPQPQHPQPSNNTASQKQSSADLSPAHPKPMTYTVTISQTSTRFTIHPQKPNQKHQGNVVGFSFSGWISGSVRFGP